MVDVLVRDEVVGRLLRGERAEEIVELNGAVMGLAVLDELVAMAIGLASSAGNEWTRWATGLGHHQRLHAISRFADLAKERKEAAAETAGEARPGEDGSLNVVLAPMWVEPSDGPLGARPGERLVGFTPATPGSDRARREAADLIEAPGLTNAETAVGAACDACGTAVVPGDAAVIGPRGVGHWECVDPGTWYGSPTAVAGLRTRMEAAEWWRDHYEANLKRVQARLQYEVTEGRPQAPTEVQGSIGGPDANVNAPAIAAEGDRVRREAADLVFQVSREAQDAGRGDEARALLVASQRVRGDRHAVSTCRECGAKWGPEDPRRRVWADWTGHGLAHRECMERAGKVSGPDGFRKLTIAGLDAATRYVRAEDPDEMHDAYKVLAERVGARVLEEQVPGDGGGPAELAEAGARAASVTEPPDERGDAGSFKAGFETWLADEDPPGTRWTGAARLGLAVGELLEVAALVLCGVLLFRLFDGSAPTGMWLLPVTSAIAAFVVPGMGRRQRVLRVGAAAALLVACLVGGLALGIVRWGS